MMLDNVDCTETELCDRIEEVLKPFLGSSKILEQVWRWISPLGSYGLVCLTGRFEIL